jgi:hypothetical protein
MIPVALVAGGLLVGGCIPPPPPPRPAVLAAACDGTLVATNNGAVAAPALDEISGVAASGRVDGVFWVHNDSGDTARVFAIGADGRDLGEYDLAGATAVDWEDIAVGPGPVAGVSYLYLGDIGDNHKTRSSVVVYRVPEPLVDPTVPAGAPQTLGGVDALTFHYPDGAHDAEGLIVDPVGGDLFVVTKELVSGTAQVFRAKASLTGGSTTTLTQVATVALGFGHGVTGADVTRTGDVVALRTYFSVALFPRPAGDSLARAFAQPPCAGAAPPFGTGSPSAEAQGEAIGFTRDGRGYLTLSEGSHVEVHQFEAP